MRRGLLGILVLVLACIASPARAETTHGSVTGVSGVLWDDCAGHSYRYSVTPPDGAGYWALAVRVHDRYGRQAASDYVAMPESSGASSVVLCAGVNPYGTYTIRATLQWGTDADHVDQSSDLAASAFTLRKPRTRTGLTASTRRPAYGQFVRYRIRVWDERPSGYLPTAFAWVVLQKKVDGHWVRIRGSRTLTHDNGRVSLRVKYRKHHKRTKVRAVALEAARYSRSTSPVVRLW